MTSSSDVPRSGQLGSELMAKAIEQESAKMNLLIEVSLAVVGLLQNASDEWNSAPDRQANEICDLIRHLKEISMPVTEAKPE